MIPTYYCIHVYIGVTCVLLLGAVVLVILVMSVVVFFPSSRSSISGGMCRGSACTFVSLIAITKAITETKLQTDTLHIIPETENKKTEKNTTDINRTTRTTAPRSSTHVTPNINMDTIVSRNHVICESQHTL